MPVLGAVGRSEDCPKCGADLRVCLNCSLYDPNSYHECRESSAELVKEKDRANFCDHFEPTAQMTSGGASKPMDLLAQADALFKKK
ncbi:MAG: hypothetical protein COT74_14005 [Bdellovibrionales bacterium CG10_big_fil_rev_8_21_14_0_10_45_34]|nr:MAG: hypothetical protein COT74_14005 [Bdellovibrionales bacterium CG10_big_fil_rev_8_21_14_0_10_45_34]